MSKKKVVILGAAGRDFHNFNTLYRENSEVEVIAFTATQIPDIAGRKYPPVLAGELYPAGIPIWDEKDLEKLIKENKIEECVLSYSDLSYNYVMRLAARVLASGADFKMVGAEKTMLKSKKPVIAVVAVRTGCGKSQTSRAVVEILRNAGKKVVSARHPMPYGDLSKQVIQRYASISDMEKFECTIEEMEEYEPHIAMGSIIYAGVDYQKILASLEKEADVVVWDGGNNDTSFFKPDLTVVIADPWRAGHEISYYPGEVNLRLADVVVINKVDSADPKNVEIVMKNAQEVNPKAIIIKAESVVTVDNPEIVKGKRVLAIEDGPTLTHGEMKIGAAIIAAQRLGAAELVDPRPFIKGKIQDTFVHYPNIGTLLPAMGYGKEQMKDLEDTINATDCDSVIIGTPIDLTRFIKINKPATRVRYNMSEEGKAVLEKIIRERGLI